MADVKVAGSVVCIGIVLNLEISDAEVTIKISSAETMRIGVVGQPGEVLRKGVPYRGEHAVVIRVPPVIRVKQSADQRRTLCRIGQVVRRWLYHVMAES